MLQWPLILLVFQLATRGGYSAQWQFRGDDNGPPPLIYDPDNTYTEQMLNTARKGLPKCLKCEKVAIIGAGVAGLITAVELSLSGHIVQIFEASDRLGGRVYTYRTSEGYLTELGAMRLPLEQHKLLGAYINDRFQLPVKRFGQSDPNTKVFINDVLISRTDASLYPDTFHFNVSENEKKQTPWALWDNAIKPLLVMDDATRLQLYGAYSVDYYLMEVANLSRGAIDFIGLMLNLESAMYTSIVEVARDFQLLPEDAFFWHIDGGNDRLITELERACRNVSNGRCSINTRKPITFVNYDSSSSTGRLQSNDELIPGEFDHIIVATTARAANAIRFEPRRAFINKYQALRQLHYDCASKIAHSFKTRWWEQFSIHGGYSITDLPARFVYYYNFNTTSTQAGDGALMLSSYTWSQDALLWSGMSSNESCRLALDNLNDLHPSIHVPDYKTGCITYNWCTDSYSLGAYALFTPYQETNIHNALGTSIDNTIHFIGEHTSLAHAWIEGAVLSSMRLQMHLQEELFEVAIIGGGPLGLWTALLMAQKQPTWRIAVIESFELGNTQGSSGSTDVRQFQQVYDKWYLSDLGRLAVPMWEDLERRANLSNGTLFDRTHGFLYIDSTTTINSTINNCHNLSLSCVLLNPTELKYNYSFISASPDQQAVFMSNSGFINVTLLLTVLRQLLEQIPKVVIRENEAYLAHDSEGDAIVNLKTTRGSLNASQVVFVPGPYAKNVSALLGFNLNMSLWELSTFYARRLLTASSSTPIWFDDSFAGYSPEANESSHAGYIRIEPHFIINADQALSWPDQRTNKPDPQLLEATRSWLRTHMVQTVNSEDILPEPSTCLASVLPDGGYLLDYIPVNNTGKRIVMGAGGWAMKYVPVFADILTDLVLGTTADKSYKRYLDQFSFNVSGRLIPEPSTTTIQSTTMTTTAMTATTTTSTSTSGSMNSQVELFKGLFGTFFMVALLLLLYLSYIYYKHQEVRPCVGRRANYQPA